MIKLGSTEIANLPGIDKVYLGSDLIWDSTPPGPRLPVGYTEVEYIENTSTAYLDTGVTPNCTVTLTAQGDSSISSNSILVATKTSAGHWFGAQYSTGKWGNGSAQLTQSWLNKTAFVVTINDNSIEFAVSGGTATTTNAAASITTSVWLFAGSPTGGNSYPFKGIVYGDVIIEKSGSKVKHYVPCTNSSNVAGWYDLVGETFYSSSNATAFVAGPTV